MTWKLHRWWSLENQRLVHFSSCLFERKSQLFLFIQIWSIFTGYLLAKTVKSWNRTVTAQITHSLYHWNVYFAWLQSFSFVMLLKCGFKIRLSSKQTNFYCCCFPISLGICLNVINCTINENMFDFSSFLSAFFSSTYFRMFKALKSYKKCEYLRQCFYTSEINSTILPSKDSQHWLSMTVVKLSCNNISMDASSATIQFVVSTSKNLKNKRNCA